MLGEPSVPKNVPTENVKELSYCEAKKSPQLAAAGEGGMVEEIKSYTNL